MQPVPPDSTYFEVFGVPVDPRLNDNELRDRYYQLSRQLHPDRYANAAAPEPGYATQWTTLVNKAYQTLKDPSPRTHYLLGLYGYTPDQAKSVPTDLADSYFDLQEIITEGTDLRALVEFRDGLLEAIDQNEIEWEILADRWGSEEDKKELLEDLNVNLVSNRYLKSMLADIGKKVSSPDGDSGN